MRIIGGKWRSRRIMFPDARQTRPMPDRIREAVFDILASRIGQPGTVQSLHVADLFAGSGSIGLEALSRGAEICDFVESHKAAIEILRSNLEALHVGPEGCILRANAWTACLTNPVPRRPYDVIFVDPPYVDARETGGTGKVPRLLSDLHRARWADGRTTVIVHHEATVSYAPSDDTPWRVADRRVYGSAAISFLMVQTREASPRQTKADDAEETIR